jgi:hypothetical protein
MLTLGFPFMAHCAGGQHLELIVGFQEAANMGQTSAQGGSAFDDPNVVG